MKNQETKSATPGKTEDTNLQVPGTGERKGLVLVAGSDGDSDEFGLGLSALELAGLAARLTRTGTTDPKQLVREAWTLYSESCRKIQEEQLEMERRERAIDAEWCAEMHTLPAPGKYPVTFHEMERLLLPKLTGRTGPRASVFREYIMAELLKGCVRIRPPVGPVSYWDFEPDVLDELREKFRDDIVKRLGELRKSVYDAKAYAAFATSFLAWYRQWTRHRNSEAKAANARKGWDKRRKARTAKLKARPKWSRIKAEPEKTIFGGLTGAESRKP